MSEAPTGVITPELKSCPQIISYLQDLSVGSELVFKLRKKDLKRSALEACLRKTVEVMEGELFNLFSFA